MKIGISGEWIGTKAGGLETYSLNLITALAEADKDNQLRVYTSDRHALSDLRSRHPNFEPVYLGSDSRWLSIPLLLPYRLLRDKLDVFHATSIAPPLCPPGFVITVHDIGYRKHPEMYPRWVRYRLDGLISSSIRRCSRIIAVSEFTKRDIIECYGIDEDKITVIYEAVNSAYRPIEDRDEILGALAEYRIPEQYVLYVGRLHNGKNLIRLLRAFHQAKLATGTEHKLVLAGRELFSARQIFEEIAKLGIEGDVVLPGYVKGEHLPSLFSGATAFVYPSLFEGFGLPPLEAMACGTPVISSSAASLPEVVGDAGLLVDPYQVEDIADKLIQVLSDSSLRADLRRRGLERAGHFNWRNTALETLEVYKQVAAG